MDTLLTKWLLIVVFGDFVYIFTSKPPVMFIRITKNKNGDAYYHLVESYREKGKVKQRTLLALGKAEEGKLEQLSSAISKYLDTIHVLDMAKHIDVKNAYIYGPLMVLERMMEELGINQVISGLVLKHQRLRFDIQKAVFTMICSRFIRPVSKLALYDQWIDQLYPVMVDHRMELQHIYRSLDILCQHKELIEQSLYLYRKDLFSINVDIVLYDLTTLRFESTRTDMG